MLSFLQKRWNERVKWGTRDYRKIVLAFMGNEPSKRIFVIQVKTIFFFRNEFVFGCKTTTRNYDGFLADVFVKMKIAFLIIILSLGSSSFDATSAVLKNRKHRFLKN